MLYLKEKSRIPCKVFNTRSFQEFVSSFSLLIKNGRYSTLAFVLVPISGVLSVETFPRSAVRQTLLNVDVLSINECLKDWGRKVALLPYYSRFISEMSMCQNCDKKNNHLKRLLGSCSSSSAGQRVVRQVDFDLNIQPRSGWVSDIEEDDLLVIVENRPKTPTKEIAKSLKSIFQLPFSIWRYLNWRKIVDFGIRKWCNFPTRQRNTACCENRPCRSFKAGGNPPASIVVIWLGYFGFSTEQFKCQKIWLRTVSWKLPHKIIPTKQMASTSL